MPVDLRQLTCQIPAATTSASTSQAPWCLDGNAILVGNC
jgi:hypothetical protein